MESVSDRELVKRFQRGDESAFEALVRRHQDRMYRLAGLRLYRSEEADDAAQEVFLRAYKGLRRFHFGAEPFTWMYRTMINVCNEHNRRVRRAQRLQAGLMAEPVQEASMPHEHEPADTQAVRSLVGRLPARQQEVVTLRIFEDLSVEDTAKAMGCRPGTVKALLHKAMHKLRQGAADTLQAGG